MNARATSPVSVYLIELGCPGEHTATIKTAVPIASTITAGSGKRSLKYVNTDFKRTYLAMYSGDLRM